MMRWRNCDSIGVGEKVPVVYMQRLLIVLGIIIAAIGVAWPWLSRLPIGRLPGDFVIDRPGFKFVFPLTTMIIVSAIASLILWLLRK